MAMEMLKNAKNVVFVTFVIGQLIELEEAQIISLEDFVRK